MTGQNAICLAPNATVSATGNPDGQTPTNSGLPELGSGSSGVLDVGNIIRVGGITNGTITGWREFLH
jgi:hypothetical protein